MLLHYLPLFIVLAAGVLYALYFKKLTVPAALAGAFIATIIFISFGYTGVAIMTAFFLLGSIATSWKQDTKRQYDVPLERAGGRTTGQVLANAGVGGLLAALCIIDSGHCQIYFLMMASAFSAATADTLSSELGMVYGSRFYNVLTFNKDSRGLDGVVSIEGTLAGGGGSIVIASVYLLSVQSLNHAMIIVIAGTIGNLFDSILGASFERRHLIGNNSVNFLNTAAGAIVGWMLSWCYRVYTNSTVDGLTFC